MSIKYIPQNVKKDRLAECYGSLALNAPITSPYKSK
jgi:hypothetical protein